MASSLPNQQNNQNPNKSLPLVQRISDRLNEYKDIIVQKMTVATSAQQDTLAQGYNQFKLRIELFIGWTKSSFYNTEQLDRSSLNYLLSQRANFGLSDDQISSLSQRFIAAKENGPEYLLHLDEKVKYLQSFFKEAFEKSVDSDRLNRFLEKIKIYSSNESLIKGVALVIPLENEGDENIRLDGLLTIADIIDIKKLESLDTHKIGNIFYALERAIDVYGPRATGDNIALRKHMSQFYKSTQYLTSVLKEVWSDSRNDTFDEKTLIHRVLEAPVKSDELMAETTTNSANVKETLSTLTEDPNLKLLPPDSVPSYYKAMLIIRSQNIQKDDFFKYFREKYNVSLKDFDSFSEFFSSLELHTSKGNARQIHQEILAFLPSILPENEETQESEQYFHKLEEQVFALRFLIRFARGVLYLPGTQTSEYFVRALRVVMTYISALEIKELLFSGEISSEDLDTLFSSGVTEGLYEMATTKARLKVVSANGEVVSNPWDPKPRAEKLKEIIQEAKLLNASQNFGNATIMRNTPVVGYVNPGSDFLSPSRDSTGRLYSFETNDQNAQTILALAGLLISNSTISNYSNLRKSAAEVILSKYSNVEGHHFLSMPESDSRSPLPLSLFNGKEKDTVFTTENGLILTCIATGAMFIKDNARAGLLGIDALGTLYVLPNQIFADQTSPLCPDIEKSLASAAAFLSSDVTTLKIVLQSHFFTGGEESLKNLGAFISSTWKALLALDPILIAPFMGLSENMTLAEREMARINFLDGVLQKTVQNLRKAIGIAPEFNIDFSGFNVLSHEHLAAAGVNVLENLANNLNFSGSRVRVNFENLKQVGEGFAYDCPRDKEKLIESGSTKFDGNNISTILWLSLWRAALYNEYPGEGEASDFVEVNNELQVFFRGIFGYNYLHQPRNENWKSTLMFSLPKTAKGELLFTLESIRDYFAKNLNDPVILGFVQENFKTKLISALNSAGISYSQGRDEMINSALAKLYLMANLFCLPKDNAIANFYLNADQPFNVADAIKAVKAEKQKLAGPIGMELEVNPVILPPVVVTESNQQKILPTPEAQPQEINPKHFKFIVEDSKDDCYESEKMDVGTQKKEKPSIVLIFNTAESAEINIALGYLQDIFKFSVETSKNIKDKDQEKSTVGLLVPAGQEIEIDTILDILRVIDPDIALT